MQLSIVPARRCDSSSVEGSAGSGVYNRPGYHARTVGRDQDRCIRRILDGRWNLKKVGLRDLRNRLVLCDVQLARQKVNRVADGPAVDIGHCSDANHPDTERTDLEGEICGEILDCAKCRANRSRPGYVRAGRAASDQDDDA